MKFYLCLTELRKDGFGKNPYYECLVAEQNNLPSAGKGVI